MHDRCLVKCFCEYYLTLASIKFWNWTKYWFIGFTTSYRFTSEHLDFISFVGCWTEFSFGQRQSIPAVCQIEKVPKAILVYVECHGMNCAVASLFSSGSFSIRTWSAIYYRIIMVILMFPVASAVLRICISTSTHLCYPSFLWLTSTHLCCPSFPWLVGVWEL
jgi:hypothetical protein